MVAPRLKKDLGQHHLRQGAVCAPLVEFLAPRGARVLEVGPGGGALTTELLSAGARVLGWELDLAWAAALRARLAHPELELVVGDALELPWERLPAPTLVAGNLPYGVATALIDRVLDQGPLRVPRAGFLVQLEVAQRLVAPPGASEYGALSVLTAARAAARLLGRVRPGSFRPPPKVHGAFVGFELRAPPLPPEDMAAFAATVHAAFAQRRKTLRNALGASWGRAAAEQVLAAAGLGPERRAQELDLEEFLRLHTARRRPGEARVFS